MKSNEILNVWTEPKLASMGETGMTEGGWEAREREAWMVGGRVGDRWGKPD